MPHIIIIGSGISGFRASEILLQRGYQVTMIEAQDRIGGRCFTGNLWGVDLDFGANWLHGTFGNPIYSIATSVGSELRYTDHSTFIDYNGQQLTKEQVNEIESRSWIEEGIQYSKLYRDKIPDSASFADFVFREIQNLDKPEDVKRWYRAFARIGEAFSGAELECLSLKNYYLEEELPGGTPYLASTFKPILEKIASLSLEKATIKLNEQVVAVSTTDLPRVTTSKASYTADGILCTVSLGVLKSQTIKFTPPLPNIITKAITNLGFGVLNKHFVRVSKRFWKDEQDWISFLPFDEHGVLINILTHATKPILIVYSTTRLNTLLQQSSGNTLALLQRYISALDSSVIIEDVYSTTWDLDPFIRGGYTFIRINSSEADIDAFRCMKDKLWFAGEHVGTGSQFATVHGAYISGERAAEDIINYFT